METGEWQTAEQRMRLTLSLRRNSFPDQVENKVDVLAESGLRRAQNALYDHPANDVGYRKRRLFRAYIAENLLTYALLEYGFDNLGFVEIQRLEFGNVRRMDAEVAELGVVDLEEVGVFIAVGELARDQGSQLGVDGRFGFQLRFEGRIHLLDSELQGCEVDIAFRLVIEVDSAFRDARGVSDVVDRGIIESLRCED